MTDAERVLGMIDRIDKLERDERAWQEDAFTHSLQADAAALESVLRDAERYRWLRTADDTSELIVIDNYDEEVGPQILADGALDAAIDAASPDVLVLAAGRARHADRRAGKYREEAADEIERLRGALAKLSGPDCPCSTCRELAALAEEPQQEWMRGAAGGSSGTGMGQT